MLVYESVCGGRRDLLPLRSISVVRVFRRQDGQLDKPTQRARAMSMCCGASAPSTQALSTDASPAPAMQSGKPPAKEGFKLQAGLGARRRRPQVGLRSKSRPARRASERWTFSFLSVRSGEEAVGQPVPDTSAHAANASRGRSGPPDTPDRGLLSESRVSCRASERWTFSLRSAPQAPAGRRSVFRRGTPSRRGANVNYERYLSSFFPPCESNPGASRGPPV